MAGPVVVDRDRRPPRTFKRETAEDTDVLSRVLAVHLAGLPPGLTATSTVIPKGQEKSRLTVTAADNPRTLWSVTAYSVGLVAMLGFSAAYHFHHASERGELLRRLDHAAIFVMIAGTYTPFTACILNGASAVWSTASMWAAAGSARRHGSRR